MYDSQSNAAHHGHQYDSMLRDSQQARRLNQRLATKNRQDADIQRMCRCKPAQAVCSLQFRHYELRWRTAGYNTRFQRCGANCSLQFGHHGLKSHIAVCNVPFRRCRRTLRAEISPLRSAGADLALKCGARRSQSLIPDGNLVEFCHGQPVNQKHTWNGAEAGGPVSVD